ncbi:uncharacterized protein Z520_01196 [Fonsecaea multimorphosa CBS 102226]|uniref:WKF domain-containing protein n=1 Tax=Fonsecaea multimorphosa CBS 102226 TaxID=1442371 RepID=A0A0D2HLD9_9EURO|nr:uncharacterized protein Z520_01196 [Fonsecaea multimorphosa CBS 102226]KIY02731.1 hypothetical protein Z520_01196 [Fonsecaea multimorphosa CBS 102226]OAL31591.1 hypothetical protein AYO22_01183 [Fonsecaea multimorphosa]
MSLPGIPAWKRLGLKLKYANENSDSPTSNGIAPPAHQAGQGSLKDTQPSSSEPPRKKQRTVPKSREAIESPIRNLNLTSDTAKGREEQPDKKLKKRVSFSADVKPSPSTRSLSPVPDDSKAQRTPAEMKKAKKARSKAAQPLVPKSNAVLEYLDQYHTARSKWKFNKNRETWMLKHIFSENDIPREFNLPLGRYIYGLQGAGARDRLKTQCMASLEKGEGNQTGSDRNGSIAGEEENGEYLRRFKDDLASPPSSNFAAAGDTSADAEYQSWIERQPRPRILLWALGFDTNALTATNGTTEKVKKRKNRTVVVDYDSSSSSSSDSDSDSGSENESKKSDANSQSHTGISNGAEPEEETSSSGSDEDSSGESDSSTDDASEV